MYKERKCPNPWEILSQLGNSLEDYSPEVFRFFVLSTNYRSPIDFSKAALEQSKNSLQRIYKLTENIEVLIDSEIPESNDNDGDYNKKLTDFENRFLNALDNDFNTPDALSILFNFIREMNKGIESENISKNILMNISCLLKDIEAIFGLKFSSEGIREDKIKELIELLVEVRETLRERKDWELSDLIRSKLKEIDINLEDK